MPKQTSLRTFLYKACPRCRGDLVLNADEESSWREQRLEYVCLQCGRRTVLELAGAREKEVARPAA